MTFSVSNRSMLYWLSAAFLLTACENSDKNTSDASEQNHAASASKVEIVTDWFKSPPLAKWEKEMQSKYTHFSIKYFNKEETHSLSLKNSSSYTNEQWQAFSPYFIYASDKKEAIDLYSYGSILPNDTSSTKELVSGEPDSEVSLVNVADKVKSRLLFAGPGTDFQQAWWLNDSIVIVTGETDANEQNKMKPVCWRINVKSQSITEYTYEDSAYLKP